MITKVIHYCWFGHSPLPPSAQKCIASWKSNFPDYEIKEWNEENFDIGIIPYVKEAYRAKKYAFVSDFARFWILYHHGGIYFDTDVEAIRPMDDIIARGSFMGCEQGSIEGVSIMRINPGVGMGCVAGLDLYKEILDVYTNLNFTYSIANQKTVVEHTTEVFMKHKIEEYKNGILYSEGIYIYPPDFFSPKSYATKKIEITKNTRTIHHFAGTWQPWWKKLLLRVWIPLSMKYPRVTEGIKEVLKKQQPLCPEH